MQNNFYSIAIDGPAGSGKSTIAKEVSKILNIEYIDTGAMYRALTWKALKKDIDPKDKDMIIKLINDTDIEFINGDIYLDGIIVNENIRFNYVSQNVSYIALIPEVRQKMMDLQRKMSKQKNVIMDGRDIGTIVLQHAKYKFFLTASTEQRAIRRYKELKQNGDKTVNLKEIELELKERDAIDSNRKIAPLRQAQDAILIDTTEKSIKEIVSIIVAKVRGR